MSSNNHFVNKSRVEKYNYYSGSYEHSTEHDDYSHDIDAIHKERYHGRKSTRCASIIFFIIFIVLVLTMLFILSNRNKI